MLSGRPAANNIYLSPHHDDAAFSLGAWLLAHPGGKLVNLFTRSIFVASGGASGVEAISAIRAAEDVAFAARVGLEGHALGLEEPKLRGRKSRDPAGVGDDLAQLREPLTAWLDEHAASEATIFVPAAIGGHVQHLATRMVAWEWAVAHGRERSLRFYEDLPYSSRLHLRRRGLLDLHGSVDGRHLRRHAWRAGAEKLDLIRLYPTQLDRPAIMRRFSPIALWPLGWHEAVWEVDG